MHEARDHGRSAMEPLHSVSRPGLSRSGLPGLLGTWSKPKSQTRYNLSWFFASSSQVNWALKPLTVISPDPTGPLSHHYDCCLLCTIRILLGIECLPTRKPCPFLKANEVLSHSGFPATTAYSELYFALHRGP